MLPELGMNNSSLPTDVVHLIIEDFISEHADRGRKLERQPERPIFSPQWYLVPLLQVCRMWHEVTEKYLYRSIAIGSGYDANGLKKGPKIAEGLLASLAMNTRLASLVETLRLGLVANMRNSLHETPRVPPKWIQTYTSIIQICPNVNRLEIRGLELDDSLFSVLKEKPLVSFVISPRDLINSSTSVLYWSTLFDAMQNWPNLRSITALDVDKDSRMLNAAQVAICCPELRDVILNGPHLSRKELEIFRTMCSGVTRLEVTVGYGVNNELLDALCDCLCTWSSTLEYLLLNIPSHPRRLYQPLSDALSTLSVLREMVLINRRMDVDAISELPRLEKVRWNLYGGNNDLIQFSKSLRDTKKFPSLKSTSIRDLALADNVKARKELEENCVGRNIDHRWISY